MTNKYMIGASAWHFVWKEYVVKVESNIMQQQECRCTDKASQIHRRNKLIRVNLREFIRTTTDALPGRPED